MTFAVTEELGRLAKWLRLMGYDTREFPSATRSLARIRAGIEGRVLLTRSRKVPTGRQPGSVRVRSEKLVEQLRQLKEEVGIRLLPEAMFSRCNECNTELRSIPKRDTASRVPLYVYQTQEQFYECPACRKLFWAGTHLDRSREFLQQIGLQ